MVAPAVLVLVAVCCASLPAPAAGSAAGDREGGEDSAAGTHPAPVAPPQMLLEECLEDGLCARRLLDGVGNGTNGSSPEDWPVVHLGSCGHFLRPSRIYQGIAFAAMLAFQEGLFGDFADPRFNVSIHQVQTGCYEPLALTNSIPLFLGQGSAEGRINSPEEFDPVIGVIGCQCSSTTKAVSTLAGPYLTPVVSGAATSTELSAKHTYQSFLRTVPPDTSQSKGLVAILAHFGWKRAVLLQMSENWQSLPKEIMEGMRVKINSDGLGIELLDWIVPVDLVAMSEGAYPLRSEVMPVIEAIAASRPQPRILVSFLEDLVYRVVAAGLREVGLVSGASAHLVETSTCNMFSLTWRSEEADEEATAAAGWGPAVLERNWNYSRGLLCMQPSARGPLFYTQAFQDFWTNLTCDRLYSVGMPADHPCLEEHFADMSHLSSQAYYPLHFDAAITLFGAVHRLLLSGTPAEKIRGKTYLDAVFAMRFEGLSGNVAFDENGDRLGPWVIMQMRFSGDGHTADLEGIGLYDGALDAMSFSSALIWHDGSTTAPKDTPEPCPDDEEYVDALIGCRACSVGQYYLNLQSGCIECLPGTFRNQSMMGCGTCPAGYYCPSGTSEPISCGLGTFCVAGSRAPAPCAEGKFADAARSTACSECGLGRYGNSTRATACQPCSDVLPGSTTEFIGRSSPDVCVCPERTYLSRRSAGAPTSCEACPEGLVCPLGLAPPLQAPAVHAGAPLFEGGAPSFCVLCASELKCPGGRALGSCPPMAEGLACDRCLVGYTEVGGECVPCSGGAEYTPVIAIFVALVAALVAVYYFESSERGPYSQSKIDVAVTAVLTLSALQNLSAVGQIDIRWIEPIKSLGRVLSVLTLSFSVVKPSCTFGFNEVWRGYLASALAYPCFALALLSVCLLGRLGGRRLSASQMANMQGSVMMSFFLPVAMVAMDPFQCSRNPDGSQSLTLHRSVLCWEGEHTTVVTLAVMVIVLLLIPFLAACLWACHAYPTRIHRKGSGDFVIAFRFLFYQYKAGHYKYSFAPTMRKLLISLIPACAAGRPLLQVLLLGWTFSFMMGIQIYLWPWRSSALNFIDAGFSMCMAMVLLAGSALLAIEFEEAKETLQIMFILVLVPAAVGVTLWLGWSAYLLLLQRTRSYLVSLAYEKGEAQALARWFKMTLLERLPQRSRIFLDVDASANDIDLMVDEVGYRSNNLVALMTKSTLSSMTCVAQIATAVVRSITVIPVACEDYSPPSDEFIGDVGASWGHVERARFLATDLTFAMLHKALLAFRQLPPVALQRGGGLEAFAGAAEAALDRCTAAAAGGAPPQAEKEERARVAIAGEFSDPEVHVAAELLRAMLRRSANLDVHLLAHADPLGMQAALGLACAVLVLLSRGMWWDQAFGRMAAAMSRSCAPAIPIAMHTSSALPPQDHRKKLEKESGPNLARLYGSLFSAVPRRFTVSSSRPVLEDEVTEIASQLKFLRDVEWLETVSV